MKPVVAACTLRIYETHMYMYRAYICVYIYIYTYTHICNMYTYMIYVNRWIRIGTPGTPTGSIILLDTLA